MHNKLLHIGLYTCIACTDAGQLYHPDSTWLHMQDGLSEDVRNLHASDLNSKYCHVENKQVYAVRRRNS